MKIELCTKMVFANDIYAASFIKITNISLRLRIKLLDKYRCLCSPQPGGPARSTVSWPDPSMAWPDIARTRASPARCIGPCLGCTTGTPSGKARPDF